jgi:hypothetical protein
MTPTPLITDKEAFMTNATDFFNTLFEPALESQYGEIEIRILRRAAERMLQDPKRSATASKIAAEILCDYLHRLGGKEINHDETSRGKEPE